MKWAAIGLGVAGLGVLAYYLFKPEKKTLADLTPEQRASLMQRLQMRMSSTPTSGVTFMGVG